MSSTERGLRLLNPKRLRERGYSDPASRELFVKTAEFFERRGLERLREDYHAKRWYAEFLDFVRAEKVFATLLTPGRAPGALASARWDTWRNAEFSELLGFYGLQYWYTWQVSVLGLGPLWMSDNEALRRRTAAALDAGGIFAFGLSEQEHGADIYATDMRLAPAVGGGWTAKGRKYYIGNGNKAAIVSTFGKIAGGDEYVFFAVDSQHPRYRCVKNVVNSQSFVAEYVLEDYPVRDEDIIARGPAAWDAALNTVNIGKYNLGWASIGICTHAFYEAIAHAARRRLYGAPVTDFSHVRQMFVDAYARLVAMKAFALRAADYMRAASAEDRRYLLFNPMVKMKVTTQGEDVINLLWDVIAAKGFERDMYFEEAGVAIRGLPKLEGTVHVNIALIVKFMANYFFNHRELPEVPRRDDPADDAFLFQQGSARGLGQIQFSDYRKVFAPWEHLPNVRVFSGQLAVFRDLLATATPDEAQREDVDFLLAVGEIFALAVYGQLILEDAALEGIDASLVDQIFDVLVRDVARQATNLHGKPATTAAQRERCLRMIAAPHLDPARYEHVWSTLVLPLKDEYAMSRSG